MIVWGKLPAEIWLMILEVAAHGNSEESGPYARAGYAGVCKDWQLFWEVKTFKRVILNQDRLYDLDRIIPRKTTRTVNYVEYIWP